MPRLTRLHDDDVGPALAFLADPGFSGSPSCDCSAPAACAAMQEQWAALEAMYHANKSRAIGVSTRTPPRAWFRNRPPLN